MDLWLTAIQQTLEVCAVGTHSKSLLKPCVFRRESLRKIGSPFSFQVSKGNTESARVSCATIRKDGGLTDAKEMELILGKLASNPEAVGILTYSYLEQFRNRIRACREPSH